jgi:hypothetical protein
MSTCKAQRVGGRIRCVRDDGHYPETPHRDRNGRQWLERPKRFQPRPAPPPDLESVIPIASVPTDADLFIPDPFAAAPVIDAAPRRRRRTKAAPVPEPGESGGSE